MLCFNAFLFYLIKKIGVNAKESGEASLELSFPDTDKKNDDIFSAGLEFKTYRDHRMAMAFAPLALVYPEIKIENPLVVKKSYPNYWNDMKSVGFEIKS